LTRIKRGPQIDECQRRVRVRWLDWFCTKENAMSDTGHVLRDGQKQLARDFQAVVDDAEELLRHAAQSTGEGYDEARGRLEQALKAARTELKAMEDAVTDGAKRAARATDGYVHEHPWESIGIGAGIGLLLGMLIARR
jgi:ElaB/YqjD/DUF883 family membrane-anchored ribosome-binding protein